MKLKTSYKLKYIFKGSWIKGSILALILFVLSYVLSGKIRTALDIFTCTFCVITAYEILRRCKNIKEIEKWNKECVDDTKKSGHKVMYTCTVDMVEILRETIGLKIMNGCFIITNEHFIFRPVHSTKEDEVCVDGKNIRYIERYDAEKETFTIVTCQGQRYLFMTSYIDEVISNIKDNLGIDNIHIENKLHL